MEDLENKFQKTIESTKSKFSSIRTGRANPSLLSSIHVDYYGSMVPLQQVASISIAEGNTFLINVFDPQAIQNVEKSIQKSDLNLNPHIEGNIIRLKLPDLTEDRRKELVKVVKGISEESKVSLRNLRRDFLDQIKKDDQSTEDSVKGQQNKVQDLIEDYNKKIDELVSEKEAEIMQV